MTRKSIQKILLAACLGVAANTGIAESPSPPPKTAEERPLRFAFVTTCKDEAFFNPVKKGIADAARMMNAKCEWMGTEEVDLPAQARMVEEAINAGYDGIAVDMIDPEAFNGVAALAAQKGIPLVSFNTDAPNARLSTVAQNLYEAGVTAGKAASGSIKPGSRVLITKHSAGVSALDDRARGIQDALKEKKIEATVLITAITAKESAEKVAAALRENSGISAVLATGQADTEGAGLAVERDFPGIYVGGFDLSLETLRLIQSGVISFTIDQQPYIQGFYPVIQLSLSCRYGIIPSSMDAGASVITKATAGAVAAMCKRGYR